LGFGTTLGANHIETLYHPLTAIMSSSKSKNLKKCYYISMRYITTNNISLIDLFCHTFGKERLGTYKCNICEGRFISDQNKTIERPSKVLMMLLTRKMYNPESVGENLRINSRVDFPFTDFMPSDRQEIHYNLFAVINHHQSSKS
jgi:hypothetical protein